MSAIGARRIPAEDPWALMARDGDAWWASLTDEERAEIERAEELGEKYGGDWERELADLEAEKARSSKAK